MTKKQIKERRKNEEKTEKKEKKKWKKRKTEKMKTRKNSKNWKIKENMEERKGTSHSYPQLREVSHWILQL